MKLNKYVYIVTGVLALGLIAFVFLQKDKSATETPSQSETATSTEQVASTTDIFDMEPIIPEAKVSTEGWKTCRNEEYGYEFQFPGEWHIYGEDALSGGPKPVFIRESQECNGANILLTKNDILIGDRGGEFYLETNFIGEKDGVSENNYVEGYLKKHK